MINKIIIIGAGGFGREVLDIINYSNEFHNSPEKEDLQVIGFVDNTISGEVNGIPVLGNDAILFEYKDVKIVVAIGERNIRRNIFERLDKLGYELPNIIHPNSYISKNAKIGKGCVIYPGAVINTGVRIGNSVLLNSNCSIGHETILEDFVNICPNVAIGGKNIIKDGTFMGIGSCTIENITLGKNNIIGAGAVIVDSFDRDGIIIHGCPAKFISSVFRANW